MGGTMSGGPAAWGYEGDPMCPACGLPGLYSPIGEEADAKCSVCGELIENKEAL